MRPKTNSTTDTALCKKLYKLLKEHSREERVTPKTTLIAEGSKSDKLYYISEGIVRGWTNHDGNEVTFQFISENGIFCSIESFWFGSTSSYSIESIESSLLFAVDRNTVLHLLKTDMDFLSLFNEFIIRRFL